MPSHINLTQPQMNPSPPYLMLITGCKDSGRSTGGHLVEVGTRAVCWSSKLQGIIALSSTKAEYSAAMEARKEIYWMWNLMSEMGIKQNKPSILHINNQSAIQVTKHPECHDLFLMLSPRPID